MVQVFARRHSVGGRERSPLVRVLPALMLVMLLGALDQTIMAPALPAVAGDLGGLNHIPIVVTAYLAAATVVMPAYGKLGDRFGRRRVLLVAIGVFMGGALLCVVAQSMLALVIARVIQGARRRPDDRCASGSRRGRQPTGAWALPGAAERRLRPGRGRWSAAGRLRRRSPELALDLCRISATRSARVDHGAPHPAAAGAAGATADRLRRRDLAGDRGARSGVACQHRWAGRPESGLGGAGADRPGRRSHRGVASTARRAADPILPLRLFRDRSFAIATAISLIGFALFGTVSYLPSYLQIATGASSTRAGLVVTCLMAGVIITLIISGQLISRTGRYRVFPIMGTALAAVGLALLATVDPSTPKPMLLGFLLLIGLGIGLTMQVMMLVAQNGVPRADLGTATSAVTFLRQIGASAGVAVVGAMITLRFTEDFHQPSSSGFPAERPGCRLTTSARCPLTFRPRSRRPMAQRYRRSSATWLRCSASPSCSRSRCPRARCATPRTPMSWYPMTSDRERMIMVDTLAGREERLVTPISAMRRDDLELAGGKGANLGELMQGGFPSRTASSSRPRRTRPLWRRQALLP